MEAMFMTKKVRLVFLLALMLSLIGCGSKEAEVWTVTCPWAETGVAARVNVETATKISEDSKQYQPLHPNHQCV